MTWQYFDQMSTWWTRGCRGHSNQHVGTTILEIDTLLITLHMFYYEFEHKRQRGVFDWFIITMAITLHPWAENLAAWTVFNFLFMASMKEATSRQPLPLSNTRMIVSSTFKGSQLWTALRLSRCSRSLSVNVCMLLYRYACSTVYLKEVLIIFLSPDLTNGHLNIVSHGDWTLL